MLPAPSLPPPLPPHLSPPPSPKLRLRTQSPSRSATTLSTSATASGFSPSTPASFTSASSPLPSPSSGKSPRRSPGRGYESVYRDLSPSKTLRAIGAHAIATDGGSETDEEPGLTADRGREGLLVKRLVDGRLVEEDRLVKSIKTASREERAFARRAAESFAAVRGCWREVDAWEWPRAGFDFPGSGAESDEDIGEEGEQEQDSPGSPIHDRQLDSGDLEYWGSLPAKQVLAYEKRLEEIADELEELDIEDQKNRVLHTHVNSQPATPPQKDTSDSSPTTDYNHLGAVTALTTATVLQALPYYSQLINLMNTWSSRILVLKSTPQFLKDLDGTREALDSAWVAFGTDLDNPIELLRTTTITSRRQSFEATKTHLEEKIATLGQQIDLMLDALEGADEGLPEYWIDAVDSCEMDYSSWTVEAQKLIMLHENRIGVEQDRIASELESESLDEHELPNQTSTPEKSTVTEHLLLPTAVPSASIASLPNHVNNAPLQMFPFSLPQLDSQRQHEENLSPQESAPTEGPSPNTHEINGDITHDLPRQDHLHNPQPEEISRENVEPIQLLQSQNTATADLPDESMKEQYWSSTPENEALPESTIETATALTLLPLHQTASPLFSKFENHIAPVTSGPDEISNSTEVDPDDLLNRARSPALQPVSVDGTGDEKLNVPEAKSEPESEITKSVESSDFLPVFTNSNPMLSTSSSERELAEDKISLEDSPASSPRAYSPPPLNAAMIKRDTTTSDLLASPDMPGIADVVSAEESHVHSDMHSDLSPLPNGSHKEDEQLDRQITSILKTVPARINFTTDVAAEETPMKSLERDVKAKLKTTMISSNNPTSLGLAGEPDAEPVLTLAPVLSTSRGPRTSNSSEIKLYHLTQPGREKPIKLFIRLIGDGGERVMVRVGGGWADLGQYLRDHVAHQSRVSSAEPHRAISPVPGSYRKSHSRHTSNQSRTSDGAAPLHFVDSSPIPGHADSWPLPSSRSQSSGAANPDDDHLGLAGPGAKKNDIGADQERWVEEMVDRAKRVGSGADMTGRWKSKQTASPDYMESGRAVSGWRVASRAASRAE